MSKLGTILQPRTLPHLPKSAPFADCNPAVPDMFTDLAKSWQNTGTFLFVQNPASNAETVENQDTDQEQAQAVQNGSAIDRAPLDEVDCPWISRLADEWQVGIETLVPLTWQSATAVKQFTRSVDTKTDTMQSRSHAARELGIACSSMDTSCSDTAPSAPTNYLASKLIEAVQNGTTSTVEQVLQLINRQSQSSVAVLLELRDLLVRNANTPLTVDWEHGMDSNGKPFMRLSFSLLNDWSKGSGATKLVIGSDGTTYATFYERWNSTPLFLSPDEAIAKIKGCNQTRVRDFNRAPQKIYNATADFKPSRVPRHFKAAGF